MVAHLDRTQPVILALLVLLAATLLPMAHVALQGSELLTANVIGGYASRGQTSPALVSAAREAAHTRIVIQPLMGPYQALALMLAMAGATWLLARWRAVRISVGTALRAAAMAIAAGMLFYVVLYVAGWALFGSQRMVPEWERVVPTSLAMFRIGPPALQRILEGITVGGLVRFTTLGVVLRKLVPTMPPDAEWVVAAGAAALTLTAFVLGSLL